jgi:3-hydroxyisobutyrate dehydrogenase-like beta-hydroxyacid dehydrogenase
MTALHLGFIGVGRMGAAMAGRLLDAGHTLTIFDTSEAALAPLVARGAKRASSAADVATAAEVILLSLPKPEVVAKVADEIAAVDGKTRLVIDLSTTGPQGAAKLAETLRSRNIVSLDAPVSGGPAGARKGTLALMVSGPRGAFDEMKPVLERFGKLFFVGEKAGLAQIMKVINNMLSVTALAISSEAMVLGAKAGIDANVMVDVLNAGSGRNSATVDKIPNFVLPRTFDFGFAVGLSCKDIRLCLEEAERRGVPMVVGSAVREMLTITRARFGEDADLTSIARTVEEWGGAQLKGNR